MNKQTILCVDDEVDNVDALERLLRKKYKILKATSGKQALAILDENPGQISVIITDQRMPEMTGVEFLEKSLAKHPDTVRLLLTGYTDLESIITAINQGQIHRYLTKPWDPVDLGHSVDQAAERYLLGVKLKETNVRLANALSELQELDRMKSEFMILINHELKTPLTSIINYSELMKESNITDEQKSYLGKIESSSWKLKNVIDDCLLVMKATTGQIKSSPQKQSYQDFLHFLDEKTRALFDQKDLKIQYNFKTLELETDPLWFAEMIKRILGNAVKFSHRSSTIIVSVQHHAKVTKLEIINEGPSLDEKKMEHLFKPFFLDENIMNHSQGLGLGLAISQGIAKALGCSLRIENAASGVKTALEFQSGK